MTTTDVIYLVKEMAICQYVMIIHSPHLCSLPGFRAPHADVEPAGIRCRQVVSDEDFEKWASSEKEEANPAESRETQLRLPWQAAKPTGGLEGKQYSWDTQQAADETTTKDSEDDEVEAHLSDELQQYLIQMLEQRTGDAEMEKNEDLLVIELAEDEDGNVHLETETKSGEKVKLEGGNEELWKAVKDFLIAQDASKGSKDVQSGDDEDEERVRDEL